MRTDDGVELRGDRGDGPRPVRRKPDPDRASPPPMIEHTKRRLTSTRSSNRYTVTDRANARAAANAGAAGTLTAAAVDAMTSPDGIRVVTDVLFELESNRLQRPTTVAYFHNGVTAAVHVGHPRLPRRRPPHLDDDPPPGRPARRGRRRAVPRLVVVRCPPCRDSRRSALRLSRRGRRVRGRVDEADLGGGVVDARHRHRHRWPDLRAGRHVRGPRHGSSCPRRDRGRRVGGRGRAGRPYADP